MATSPCDIAQAQVQLLEDTLRQLDQRAAGVCQALEDAEEVLERAKRDVDALRLERETMQASRAALQADIDARRTALACVQRDRVASRARKILASFPTELLRLIFVEAANMEDVLWPPGHKDWVVYEYDQKDATTPFWLASVNRQWRAVALSTADIWTCVTATGFGVDGSGCLERIKAMLTRSKDRELCIMLCWATPSWRDSRNYERILGTLAKQSFRWRRVNLRLPRDVPESALDCLLRPMGRLEDINLSVAQTEPIVDWWAPKPFPLCPRMRRLCSHVLFARPRRPLTRLVYLFLVSDGASPLDIWEVPRMARDLVNFRVELSTAVGTWPVVPPAPLSLPKLQILALYGPFFPPPAWLDSFQLPALHTLQVDIDIMEALAPLFDAVAKTVTSLFIHAVCRGTPFLASHLDVVRKLGQLRHLAFVSCSFVGPEIPSIFASREAAGLQHLQDITMKVPLLDDQQGRHLADLMQSLGGCPPAQREDASLRFIMLAGAKSVPDWLLRQYEFLSGDGSDRARSPVPSEPCVSEDESDAVFTDGTIETTSSERSDSDSGEDGEWASNQDEDGEEDDTMDS